MIGLLLVTHGRLAEELRAAALTIQPGLDRIVAVALEWKPGPYHEATTVSTWLNSSWGT